MLLSLPKHVAVGTANPWVWSILVALAAIQFPLHPKK